MAKRNDGCAESFAEELDTHVARVPRFLPKPWLLSNRDQIVVASEKLARALLESSLLLMVFPLARAVDCVTCKRCCPSSPGCPSSLPRRG